MSESEFIAAMMARINEHCPGEFTAECVEQARSRDPELDRLLRALEQRPVQL